MPDDVLGRAQSGQAPLQLAAFLVDARPVRLVRRIAERTLEDDPALAKPGHAALREFALETDRPAAMLW